MLLIPYQFSRVIIGNTICLVDTKILNLHSTIICATSTPLWRIIQKESVELLVYLTIGIWRGPRTNKQYPTLEQYIEDDIATQVMSVCIAYPCSLKIAKFYCQG